MEAAGLAQCALHMSDYEQFIYLLPYLFHFQVLSLAINPYLKNDDLRITEYLLLLTLDK